MLDSAKRPIPLVALTLLVLATLFGGTTLAQEPPEIPEDQPAHLVIETEGNVRISRVGWDILAESPIFAGSSLQEGDYLVFSGSSRAVILCADLTVQEQFADGVPDCVTQPETPAFHFADRLEWLPETTRVQVSDATVIPDDTADVTIEQIPSDDLDTLTALQQDIIETDGLAPETTAFALANLYARYDLYFDAIALLTEQEAIQCTERAIVRPEGVSQVLEAPAAYLRLGEWSYYINDLASGERYFTCAFQLAEEIGDTGYAALAAVRLGDITDDETQAAVFYQNAIDRFATLEADEAVDQLLGICGTRNCTDPR